MAPTTLPAAVSAAAADRPRSGGGGGGSGRERKRKATSSPVDSENSIETTRSTVTSSGTSGGRLSSPPDAGLKEGSSSSSSSSAHQQNVRVVARLRPLSAKELSENSTEAITATPSPANADGTLLVDKSRRFEYDAVFHPKAAQAEVYEQTAGDSIQCSLFKGFNVTILAYGQVRKKAPLQC